jgi:CheY-like chemotaxis protein
MIDEQGDCHIEWRERGGPPVTPPSRQGFGTALLDRSVPFDLNGESDVSYMPEGVNARFRLPARHVRRAARGEMADAATALSARLGSDGIARDLPILLLEDQMLIAMDVEAMLSGRGFSAIATASTVTQALKSIERSPPAFAILDVNLGDGTSIPVAEALTARGIPFIFATGYGEGGMIPVEFETVPVLRKPYEVEALMRTLSRLLSQA